MEVQYDDHSAIDVPDEQLALEEAERLAQEAEEARQKQERELIQKMFRRFRRAQEARQDKDEIWNILDMFDRGEQWKDANIPPWVPKPVLNFIRHYRTLKRANLAAGIARPTFKPVTPADEPFVQKLQKAHDHVWDVEKVPRTIRSCINRALLTGTAISMVYTDESYIGGKYYPPEPVMNPTMPNQVLTGPDGQPVMMPSQRSKLYQGKICVKRFPIENFFPDPDAYRLDDCKFVEITEILPFSSIKNNKRFREYAGDKLDNLKALRPDSESDASGEIFIRDHKISESSNPDEGDEVVTLHTHYQRYVNEDGKWQMDIFYYLQNPDIMLYEIRDAQPNIYPFAVYYDEEEEKDFWGLSQAMTGMLESQKVVNKVQQVAATIGALHQNPQKVVLRESGINVQEMARTGNVPGKVWASNVPRPVEVIQPVDIPRGLFDLDERTKSDMREMAGLNEAYMGQSVGSLTTSTGVDSLIERATIRDRDKMIQIDEFVERISHLIVLNIVYKWKEERPIPTANPDGSTSFQTWEPISQVDADNLEWVVKSDVYAKSPVTQSSRRQQADKLMQMQGQFQFQPAIIEPEEWIKFQEFDDGPDILARMQADRMRMQQQQQMAASGMLAQQIMMLAQGMATQQIPPDQMQMMVQQLVQVASQPAMAMGQPPGAEGQQQPSAPGQPQLPQGATSQVAMANMAQGGM